MTPLAKAKLRLLGGLAMVIALTSMDVRDLVYKLLWLGPYDSFKFSATGNNVIELQPLALTMNLPTSGQALDRPNGWSSLLETCAHIYPSGAVFRVALAANCSVGSSAHPRVIPRLVLASSVRVDSVAWACCRLLSMHRQPRICNEQIARGFQSRYHMESINVPTSWFALPDSPEETELLELLDVIAASVAIHRVTCVEGFEYTGPGQYNATIVGCGSPNHFRSAFAGLYATKLRSLMFDKAYLTAYDLNVMGFHYYIRENCVSDFVVQTATTSDGHATIDVLYTTIINFSTYGQLYALQIVNDVALLIVNVLSALQVGLSLVMPAFRSNDPASIDNFLREGYASFFECTLYRSSTVIAMIMMSQLLSWLLVIPNSVIWNWGISLTGKVQAYLTTLRLWTLILIIVNIAWDFFTFLREDVAYRIATFTFLMPAEIIVVGAAVSYLNRKQIFNIVFQIDDVELQRTLDATSFQQHMAASNAYNPELDYKLSTSTQLLWIMYLPLFTILFYSLTAVVAYAAVKYCVYYYTPFGHSRYRNYLVTAQPPQSQSQSQSRKSQSRVIDATNDSSRGGSTSATTAVATTTTSSSDDAAANARTLGTFVHFGEKYRSFVPDGAMSDAAGSAAHATQRRNEYARLPLERLLNKPIRARSLTRSALQLDHVVNHERFVAAQLYLEFGVFFIDGRMKPRWGFADAIPPVVQVDHTVISDMIPPLAPDELLKRLRSATKSK